MNLIERWKAKSTTLSIRIQIVATVLGFMGATVVGLPELINPYFPNLVELDVVVKIGGVITAIGGFLTAVVARFASVKLPE